MEDQLGAHPPAQAEWAFAEMLGLVDKPINANVPGSGDVGLYVDDEVGHSASYVHNFTRSLPDVEHFDTLFSRERVNGNQCSLGLVKSSQLAVIHPLTDSAILRENSTTLSPLKNSQSLAIFPGDAEETTQLIGGAEQSSRWKRVTEPGKAT